MFIGYNLQEKILKSGWAGTVPMNHEQECKDYEYESKSFSLMVSKTGSMVWWVIPINI